MALKISKLLLFSIIFTIQLPKSSENPWYNFLGFSQPKEEIEPQINLKNDEIQNKNQSVGKTDKTDAKYDKLTVDKEREIFFKIQAPLIQFQNFLRHNINRDIIVSQTNILPTEELKNLASAWNRLKGQNVATWQHVQNELNGMFGEANKSKSAQEKLEKLYDLMAELNKLVVNNGTLQKIEDSLRINEEEIKNEKKSRKFELENKHKVLISLNSFCRKMNEHVENILVEMINYEIYLKQEENERQKALERQKAMEKQEKIKLEKVKILREKLKEKGRNDEKIKEEEQRKMEKEEERKKVEAKKKEEEEERKRVEAKKKEEEKEAKRLAAEKEKKEKEEKRLAAEKEKKEKEEKRLAAEKEKKEKEEKRLAAEKEKKETEEKRLAAEKEKKETEEKRLAAEKEKKEKEEKRLAAEKEKKETEEKRLAAEKEKKETEEKRLAAEKEKKEKRLAAEKEKKEKEEKRLAAEKEKKEKEEKRLAAEKEKKETEEKRLAAEKEKKETEEKRLAAEKEKKEKEEKRLAAEKEKKETEEKRLAAEKGKKEKEEKRLAAEKEKKEKEEKRLAAEKEKKETEEKRLAAEKEKKEKEEKRLAAEKEKKEKEEKRLAAEKEKKEKEEKRLAAEKEKKETEEKRLAAEKEKEANKSFDVKIQEKIEEKKIIVKNSEEEKKERKIDIEEETRKSRINLAKINLKLRKTTRGRALSTRKSSKKRPSLRERANQNLKKWAVRKYGEMVKNKKSQQNDKVQKMSQNKNTIVTADKTIEKVDETKKIEISVREARQIIRDLYSIQDFTNYAKLWNPEKEMREMKSFYLKWFRNGGLWKELGFKSSDKKEQELFVEKFMPSLEENATNKEFDLNLFLGKRRNNIQLKKVENQGTKQSKWKIFKNVKLSVNLGKQSKIEQKCLMIGNERKISTAQELFENWHLIENKKLQKNMQSNSFKQISKNDSWKEVNAAHSHWTKKFSHFVTKIDQECESIKKHSNKRKLEEAGCGESALCILGRLFAFGMAIDREMRANSVQFKQFTEIELIMVKWLRQSTRLIFNHFTTFGRPNVTETINRLIDANAQMFTISSLLQQPIAGLRNKKRLFRRNFEEEDEHIRKKSKRHQFLENS